MADLARRHGHHPPTTLTDRTPTMTTRAPKRSAEQPLEQFVEWFRTDLVYKAPETWPGHISWFLDQLVARYGAEATDDAA